MMDDFKNVPDERPISPHIQIYRPQSTSILSISHRISGIFLVLGLVISVLFISFTAMGERTYYYWQYFSISILGKIFLFLCLLALTFHALNGIRHLLWVRQFGMTIKYVELSGIIICILSLVFTFIFSILVWI